ncbi:MAG: L-serine ammonia-lyase [Mycobacterium sp.]
MAVGVFELFSVGIGPSSSHTVGPMRAAARFVAHLADAGVLDRAAGIRVELFGSLGATGQGHGTVDAVVLGLEGNAPESMDPPAGRARVAAIRDSGRLQLAAGPEVAFDIAADIVLTLRTLAFHSNGMLFAAIGAGGEVLAERTYFSVGGGFVVDEDEAGESGHEDRPLRYPFGSAAELVALAEHHGISIAELMLRNEPGSPQEVRDGLLRIWAVMQQCVTTGLNTPGVLPGVLRVRRRASLLAAALDSTDPMFAMDWVTVHALAVNEENAAGGRVVTAPTNGAAGVIPAVLHYYARFLPGADDDGIVEFLLTAGAIGVLFKANASISGAEVGCQGEVGSACSMAAAGLAAVMGGTPAQIENAAEIGIEHNLGLTCDPVGGLVQIPCIERNAVASIKAITAARLALRGDGVHHVSLDTAIKTMRETGADMQDKYKETSLGGLALNVVEC